MRNKQILCAVFILGFINTYRKIEFYVTEGRGNLGGLRTWRKIAAGLVISGCLTVAVCSGRVGHRYLIEGTPDAYGREICRKDLYGSIQDS